MKHYSFLFEADQINLENPSENNGFEPLIKDKSDIPLSTDQAKKMEIVAKIRQIEAKTKELEASAKQKEAEASMGGDPSMGGGIDPMTGMPMGGAGGIDPMTGMPMGGAGGIDPMTGMPMGGAGGEEQNDPLQGLGDKSAPMDPMGGGGGIDPMTGMPMDGGGTGTATTALGRAYTLKKIFENLIKIKTYLRDTTNIELSKLYKDIDTAFEMFKLVINNLKTYKENVDELILMYFELIKLMLEKIKNTLNESEPQTE